MNARCPIAPKITAVVVHPVRAELVIWTDLSHLLAVASMVVWFLTAFFGTALAERLGDSPLTAPLFLSGLYPLLAFGMAQLATIAVEKRQYALAAIVSAVSTAAVAMAFSSLL